MKTIHLYLLFIVFILAPFVARCNAILIAMDETQKNHLKSYGLAYWTIKNNKEVSWLLNYRGGSFMTEYNKMIEDECKIRGISYEVIADSKANEIVRQISDPSVNMDVIKLEKLPKIAVYSPKDKGPFEDAVVMVLNYAEIPFDYLYDEEVLKGDLSKYDWLHLHHEDFTGQYGKENSNAKWYVDNQVAEEARARKLGFTKVSKLKLAVVLNMRNFIENGGFLFAMCSGTDTFDIALAAANTDICDAIYDGDPPDPNAQSKLDYSATLAFQNFTVVTNPNFKKVSDIDLGATRRVNQEDDFFTLFDFSAKWDVVASMLTQNHDRVIKSFNGAATAFDESKIKQTVTILGETKKLNEARYLHGELGKGQWTFFAGHDPEDYQRHPGDPATDLSLHPNSPGYRLILNNLLFPAAKKKKQKT